jgi:hypothetical protein
MKKVMSKKKKGIYLLPCTGSNSTDFSCVHVSNSDVFRLNMDIDLLDDDDSLDFFVFDDVPASVGISSSSGSSSSPSPLSTDRVTPATGFSYPSTSSSQLSLRKKSSMN